MTGAEHVSILQMYLLGPIHINLHVETYSRYNILGFY